MKEDSQRLFIAITVPERVKVELEKAQAALRRATPENSIRWTGRGQFHLTLRFLGDVSIGQIDELVAGLKSACGGFPALRLKAARIGFFPDTRFPRVVWAGVRDETDMLAKLQQAVVSAVQDFTDEKPEGKFAGHITLGRIKSLKRSDAEILSKAADAMADRFFGEWVADKVELIRSELSAGGSRYTTIATAPLSANV